MANNKAVVKLGLTDGKSKKAAKKALVHLQEVKSFTMDYEKSTLVVMGVVDPTVLVQTLRKYVCANLVMFGPEKDEGKPPKNDGGGGKVDQKPPQEKPQQEQQPKLVYRPYDYGMGTCGCCYGHCYCYS